MRFTTAQKNMKEFLDSDDFKTAEDAQTTIASIPILKKIIDKGLVTENSQEGLILSGYNSESKMYYLIKERAYVSGIMKKDEAYMFVENFNTQTDKIAFIQRSDPSKEYDTSFYRNKVISIPVTMTAHSKTKGELAKKKFFSDSAIPLSIPINGQSKLFKSIKDDIEVVVVIDPVYGRNAQSKNGIYNDILTNL